MRAKNILYGVEQARAVMRSLWPEALQHIASGRRLEVEFREERRNLDQNALMWKLLQTLADRIPWHGQHLSKEDWKELISAHLKKQKVVPGIDGGFVVIGASTSKMTKSELSEMIEVIYAFGAGYGIEWGEETV